MCCIDRLRWQDISSKYRWRDAEGRETDFLTDDEIENLTIRMGTLNAAERRIINRHIEISIQMLEALPWPRHLKRVPEYAGGHHERMDGKGIRAGSHAIDVRSGALHGDRRYFRGAHGQGPPYKKGKTLSESLEILGRLKLDGHIDPDLFDVFMWEEIYLKYAEQYLDSDQIDELDLSGITGYVPPPAARLSLLGQLPSPTQDPKI